MAAQKWEHLICETGDHKWKRPAGQRGRKPRFCEKHKPTPVVTSTKAAPKTLHCEIGNHDWVREPTRGRQPHNCPKHQPVHVVQANTAGNRVTVLHCEIGNHLWERESKRGRKPTSCPEHSAKAPVPATENDEEREAAALARSRERVDALEGMLKERGTHLSQQTPYILYKKVAEKAGRKGAPPTTTWERVTEHSPLAQAQFINRNQKAFDDGDFRYERHGKVIVL